MNKLMIVGTMLVGGFGLQAGVFDDAAFWYHSNSRNTSGTFATGDLKDVRYAADSSHALNQSYGEGVKSNLKFRDEQVVYPFLCETNVERCLYFNKTISVSGGSTNCHAGAIHLPDLFNVTNAGPFSVAMRFRWDGIDERVSNVITRTELVTLGLDGSKDSGYYLSIDPTTRLMSITDGSFENAYTFGNSKSPSGWAIGTNVWTEIMLTVSPLANGKSRATLYLFDENKNQQSGQIQSYYTDIPTTVTGITDSSASIFRLGAVDTVPSGSRVITANKTPVKVFNGSISQLAIWPRALSKEEFHEVFGGNAMKFELGVENNSASEFGGTGSEVTANVTNSWYHLKPRLTATDQSVAIKFNIGSHEAGLPQVLRIATTADSAAGTVDVTLNDTDLGTMEVKSGAASMMYIREGNIKSGENTLVITWNGTGDLVFDAVSLGGSWQIGYDDLSNAEFLKANRYRKTYFMSSPNAWAQRVNRTVSSNSGYEDENLHFSLPSYLTDTFRFKFESLSWSWVEDKKTYPTLKINLNGTLKASETVNSSALRKFKFEPGELVGGDNTLCLSNVNTVSSSISFDYFRLRIRPEPKGMVLSVR